jgi:hypothetical protein
MRVSLPRKHCPKLGLVLLGFLLSASASGKSAFDLTYSLRMSARTAFHLSNAADLAMNRYTIEGEQNIKRAGFTAVLAGRVYAESAFAMNSRYNAPVREVESQEFTPRDVYLQYKGHGLQFRLGNQQVVWGESYGFFFADIVNPKDTREGGLGGDLAAQRIAIPMANLLLFSGWGSLQLLYIPKPFLNMTPAQGSDFAPQLGNLFPSATVTTADERIRPMALDQSELGARASTLISGWDMALFFFNYFDRRPSYRPVFNSATDITLRGVHDPIQSFGFTGTKDLDTWVARFELLYTRGRPVDAYSPNAVNPTQSFYTGLSDEFVGVLGFDYTQWREWHLSFQVAQDSYFKAIPGSFIPQHATNLSVVLGGTLFHNHEMNVIASYTPNDGSSLWQFSYMVPVSSRLEATFGAYLFEGGGSSQYGSFTRANRAFIQLKGFFGGA